MNVQSRLCSQSLTTWPARGGKSFSLKRIPGHGCCCRTAIGWCQRLATCFWTYGWHADYPQPDFSRSSGAAPIHQYVTSTRIIWLLCISRWHWSSGWSDMEPRLQTMFRNSQDINSNQKRIDAHIPYLGKVCVLIQRASQCMAGSIGRRQILQRKLFE